MSAETMTFEERVAEAREREYRIHADCGQPNFGAFARDGFDAAVALFLPKIDELRAEVTRIRTGHVCDDKCGHTIHICERCGTGVGGKHPRMECDEIARLKARIAELEAKLDKRYVGELAAPGEC